MPRVFANWLCFALLAAATAAFAAPPLRVVASIPPLAHIARDLAGDWLALEVLLEGEIDAHHASLSWSQRRALEEADLVLWVGPQLEAALADPLGRLPEERVLSMAAVVSRGDADPHYWLDPERAAAFASVLAARLAALAPDRADALATAQARWSAALARQVAEIEGRLAGHGNRALVVEHQAWGHFARRFRLSIAGALSDESGVAAGPRTLARLAARRDVACVLVERLPASRRAARLAERLGVPVVAVDPLGRDLPAKAGYLHLLAAVAEGIASCLGNHAVPRP
ncbi:MAG: high-affinity zinc ABC transporter substrate-binding protein [Porticoccaceae bacterium]|nr:MAG: high-affinity zinc ABC transporter substrate-binding protein [Porticoccaceae bacterium]